MRLDPNVILNYWPLFLQGARVTAEIAAIAFVGGLLLASLVTAAGFSRLWLLRALVTGYLAVLRGVPFIVLLFLVHYGLPFAGVRISAWFNGTVALTLFASAYYAEVLRATVMSLPKGQWDSARAIGMSPWNATRHIIAPQILRPALPPTVNCTLTMVKESSILSAITVGELTYQGLVVQGNTFAPFEVFFAVAGLYWLMTFAFSRAAGWVDRRIGGVEDDGIARHALARRYLSLEAGK